MEVRNCGSKRLGIGEKSLAEQLWLAYFNSYLFEHGVITESARNRMAIQIKNRKPSNNCPGTMER